MLALIECFIIKYTIPSLIDDSFFKKKLSPAEFANLQATIQMNEKLIGGVKQNNSELVKIQKYFISRIKNLYPECSPLDILPDSLNFNRIPSLQTLTVRFLNNHKQLLTKKNLNRLPVELISEIKSQATQTIRPFGALSCKEAHATMKKLQALLDVESKSTTMSKKDTLQVLKIAIMCGQYDLVKTIIAKLHHSSSHSKTMLKVLKSAIRFQQNDSLQALLKINPSIDAKPLLRTAALYGNFAAFDLIWSLIDKNDLVKFHLLHAAAKSGNLYIIDKLLKLNFDPTVRDTQGLLPVHSAISSKNSFVFDRLYPFVTKILTDEDHFQAFKIATLHASSREIKYLMEQGLSITKKNTSNENLIDVIALEISQMIAEEKKLWGKIFSPFNSTKTLEFLIAKSKDEPPTQISAYKNILSNMGDNSRNNHELNNNIANLVDHQTIAPRISMYERHIIPRPILDKALITIIFFLGLFAFAFLGVGIWNKKASSEGECTGESSHCSDKTGNILITLSIIMGVFDAVLSLILCMPRKIFPCSNFFRNNRREQDLELDQRVHIIDLPVNSSDSVQII